MTDRELFLGSQEAGERLLLDGDDLTTHGVIVGMTGSGKTGLSVVMLEELLKRGVPVLVLDPKGDMGNLALAFEEMTEKDFRRWVPSGEDAAEVAKRWREGVERDGHDADSRKQYLESRGVRLITPGSAVSPLNILGSMAPPPQEGSERDPESLLAEISSLTLGLLRLIGHDSDPLTDPQFILVSNLIQRAWSQGEAVSISDLISMVQNPPMRKVGVFDLETFFPLAERRKLALQFNALLANPSFSPWLQGVPLNIDRLLWDERGRPQASVLYLSHLSENERQFVVTLVLSRLITWMHGQSGSPTLRAVVYMDEVFGFVPPSSNPPSKKPILTLLKQARAYGVGVVLATQNPVDLDYKAMSNAGTWMIGRLQTERDKLRILEALQGVSGDVDMRALDARISSLKKREFILHQSGKGSPVAFSTRWALSYLRGPLTKAELSQLSAGNQQTSASDTAPKAGDSASARDASEAPESSLLADDEIEIPPGLPPGVKARYLHPSANWAERVSADFASCRYEAALAGRVRLHFDERSPNISHDEEWEAIVYPLTQHLNDELIVQVDHDDRDFADEPVSKARYVLPSVPLDAAATFKDYAKRLKDWLYHSEQLELLFHPELKLCSRPGESAQDFGLRCQELAAERTEVELEKLHEKTRKKLRSLEAKTERTQGKLERAEQKVQAAKRQELVSGATGLLGVLFGGSRKSRGIVSKVARQAGGFSSRRAKTTNASMRRDSAEEELEQLAEQVAELEQVTAEQAILVEESWQERAGQFQPLKIGLEKSDIRVEELSLVWLPKRA